MRIRQLFSGPAALFIAILTLAACGLTGPAHQAPPAGTVAIDMGLHSYGPDNVSIRVGQTVTWRNTSIVTHSVTADPARSPKAALPPGVPAFDSGDVRAGEVFSRTFTVPGTYRYYCTHHDGMVGTITVTR